MSSSSRVFCGGLDNRVRERDLESLFAKYGRIEDLQMKNGFCFIQFSDDRDAEDAVRALNRTDFDGCTLRVEVSRGRERGSDRRDDDRGRRGRSQDRDVVCFGCKQRGHWARDCPDRSNRDRCFNCYEHGHQARECPNPSRRQSGGGNGGSRRSRSPPRRRSPSPRRGYSPRRGSVSPPRRGYSPRRRSASPPRRRSPSPRRDRSPPPPRRDRDDLAAAPAASHREASPPRRNYSPRRSPSPRR